MKNKRICKTLSALCLTMVVAFGFTIPAFAQGSEQAPAAPAEDSTNDSNVIVEETEPAPALTPEGNAALVDDFGGNKQLITVTTKAGNYFYILIDRANEDKELSLIHIFPLYWHYHVGVVYLYLYRYLWPYDRDLPCNFGGSRSNGCNDGQRMGRYGTELPPIPAGTGLSSVSHYRLRGNLCCAGAEHRSGR